jgi:hypothetical protein
VPRLFQSGSWGEKSSKARYYQRSHSFSTPATVLRFQNNTAETAYNPRRVVDVFMREVKCANCGTATRHLLPILERIIQLQSVSLKDGTHINYACPECNTLTRSLVVRGANVFREVDLSKFPDDLTLYGVSLQCAKTGCESRVILLAPVKREIDEDDWMKWPQ